MKNIPLSTSNFYGLSIEDPYIFIFEFGVLCRSYDYILDVQKIKLFPATLKGASLCWFIGLGGQTILTWENMKHKFFQRYQEYCKA